MFQKFIISRFHREAGLLFFTINFIILLVCTGCFGIDADATMRVQAEEPVVVVIDPGHGGENLGGEYEDYTEKEMTMVVANAMKAELEQYDGIRVYMTRTTDKDMTLEERCEYAASVNADFIFCLHFNLSEYHTLFGAETWISAFGEQYSRGYEFASIEMELLQEKGLYSRGIKTRLNNNGIDYYGIIRHATERNIPCALIEHCHLDEENDKPFYDHKEKLEEFGRLDAEAVARYYKLKSDSLGKDFSDYEVTPVPVPAQVMKPDSTEPDICMIELVEQNTENGEVTISVSANDYDSGMLYYTYSYDGGETFSRLQKWPDKSKDTFHFTIQLPSGIVPRIVVNVYNGYDLYTTSNEIDLPSIHYDNQEEDDTEAAVEPEEINDADEQAVATDSSQILSKEDYEEISYVIPENTEEAKELTVSYFIGVCIICAVLVFLMMVSMIVILRSCKRRKKRRRYK